MSLIKIRIIDIAWKIREERLIIEDPACKRLSHDV